MNFLQASVCSVTFILQLQLLLSTSKQIFGNPLKKSTPLKLMPTSSNAPFHPQTKKLQLITETSIFVRITQNGGIAAIQNCGDNGTVLELTTVGNSLVTLKGVQSGRYIAMNKDGRIYTTTTSNDEAVFKQKLLAEGWYTYASNKYYISSYHDAFLAFNDAGNVKKAQRTKVTHRSTHFLELRIGTCPPRRPL